MKLKTTALFVLLLVSQLTFGQNVQEAKQKGREAIVLVDKGQLDEGIKLLKEAQKLDPENMTYPYEIAYALYVKQDFKGAVKYLEDLLKHKDVNDRVYQLLGNCYDNLGKKEKAIETYEKGIALFPDAGNIYLEIGIVYMVKEDYNKALGYYEKGISVDPAFPSNYYWASKIYCASKEEVWGMIYGELFMNLERNSKRTAEISKLLYDTYKSEITVTSDSSFSVSFSQNATMNVSDPKNIKLPYGIGFYEPALMMSMIMEKSIDLNSLDRIRTGFLAYYEKGENKAKYPNVLFDYQQKMLQAGQLEAYNHWLLMKGDEDAFIAWREKNPEQWESFQKWFNANRIELDKDHKFYSGQYN